MVVAGEGDIDLSGLLSELRGVQCWKWIEQSLRILEGRGEELLGLLDVHFGGKDLHSGRSFENFRSLT